jgi:hypothetical protein
MRFYILTGLFLCAVTAECQGELRFQSNQGGYLNMDVQGGFDVVGGITQR